MDIFHFEPASHRTQDTKLVQDNEETQIVYVAMFSRNVLEQFTWTI